jgi:hypothetical protein
VRSGHRSRSSSSSSSSKIVDAVAAPRMAKHKLDAWTRNDGIRKRSVRRDCHQVLEPSIRGPRPNHVPVCQSCLWKDRELGDRADSKSHPYARAHAHAHRVQRERFFREVLSRAAYAAWDQALRQLASEQWCAASRMRTGAISSRSTEIAEPSPPPTDVAPARMTSTKSIDAWVGLPPCKHHPAAVHIASFWSLDYCQIWVTLKLTRVAAVMAHTRLGTSSVSQYMLSNPAVSFDSITDGPS